MLCNVMHYCFCNSFVYRINLAQYLANIRNVMPYPSPSPLALATPDRVNFNIILGYFLILLMTYIYCITIIFKYTIYNKYIYYIFVYTFENVLICGNCRTFN